MIWAIWFLACFGAGLTWPDDWTETIQVIRVAVFAAIAVLAALLIL